jgi:hypothetical protein
MTRLPYQDHLAPELWIVGIGSQYPEHRVSPQDLDSLAEKHYDVRSEGYGNAQ